MLTVAGDEPAERATQRLTGPFRPFLERETRRTWKHVTIGRNRKAVVTRRERKDGLDDSEGNDDVSPLLVVYDMLFADCRLEPKCHLLASSATGKRYVLVVDSYSIPRSGSP